MGRWSGSASRGAKRADRDEKRYEAEARNEMTAPRNRRVNRLRAKRPKQESKPQPDSPVITCPWPWKDAHPDKAAARRKLAWLRSRDDKDFRTAEAYKCPGPDDHWHLGNPAVPAERSRKERYQRDEEAA